MWSIQSFHNVLKLKLVECNKTEPATESNFRFIEIFMRGYRHQKPQP
jgi:hypothetical protein